ncbi:MAG TPA: hypothetical protein VFB73_08080 [Chloroflexota bacterium]|nr:hypothetical protein [Chloroflexota bacterium]
MVLSRLVRALGAGRPASPAAAAAPEAITYNQLLEQLAERLYREALARGGGLADVGLLGPAAFRPEAAALLQAIALGAGDELPPP